MKKNRMFMLLWICSALAFLLAYYKFLDREWFETGYLAVIGISIISISLYTMQVFNRWVIPVEVDQPAATNISPVGPIIMKLSREEINKTLLWAFGFFLNSIAFVHCSDALWAKWLSYLAAFLLMLLGSLVVLFVENLTLDRVVADSEGIEVVRDWTHMLPISWTRILANRRRRTAWRDVGAVKRRDIYYRRMDGHQSTVFDRRELVLLSHEGAELLNLEDPLEPRHLYQQFLDSIPIWTGLTVQNTLETR